MSEIRRNEENNRKKEYLKTKRNRIFSIKELVTKNKVSKALSEVDRYLEDYPNDSYGLVQKANILMILNCYDDAEEIYDFVIENGLEGIFSAMYKKGVIRLIKSDKEMAETLFRRNIEESPYPEIYSRIALANIEFDKGNYDNVFNILDGYYDKEIDGEDFPSIFDRFKYDEIKDIEYMKLSKIAKLLSLDRKKEAGRLWETINIEDKDNNFLREYYLVTAKLNRTNGDYDKALDNIRKISGGLRDRIYWDAKEEEARIKLKSGDLLDAIEICEQIVNNGNSPNLNYALEIMGTSYEKLREYEKARKTWLRMDEMCNNEELLGSFNIGLMEYRLGNYNEALETLRNLRFRKDKIQQQLKFYRALALLKTKNYKEAYQKLVQVDKSSFSNKLKSEYFFAKIYLKKVLNKYLDKTTLCNSYTKRQIISYNKEDTLKEIDKVHTKDGKTAVFNMKINLRELIEEVPILLKQDSTVIIQNIFMEIYQIEYPNIGFTHNGDTNTFNVVMLPNREIITMYPCDSISDSKGTKGSNKEYRKSAIDRFNSRYSNKM